MKTVEYHGAVFNIKGLSEYTGVPYTTLAWRLRQGWSAWEAVKGVRVHDTVNEFMKASDAEYIDDMEYTTRQLFEIYARWCEKEGLDAIVDLKYFTVQMQNWGWSVVRQKNRRVFKMSKFCPR